MQTQNFLNRVLPFFDEIGIPYLLEPIDFNSFLKGLGIQNGVLYIDLEQLENIGDILHEAGHIAVTTCGKRGCLDQEAMANNKEIAGDELVAMLWSYAAAVHLEIPAEVVFHENGYKGQSKWILQQYSQKEFIGLPLLQWMQMAYWPEDGPEFPKMKAWTRP